MLDFTELPDDGVAFEQLIREMLLLLDMSPHWTGRGPDGGRDILVDEDATGVFGTFRRKWLVSCKHNAHSGKSVGVGELASALSDCSRVNAQGYLVACSTTLSSAAVQALSELQSSTTFPLLTRYWDHVEIERRLNQPNAFSLIHIFFPISGAKIKWKIYNTTVPNRWLAHYEDYLFYLTCRDANLYGDLKELEVILRRLREIKPAENEYLRPRAFYYDDKHVTFHAYLDYIVTLGPGVKDGTPSLGPLELATRLCDGIAMPMQRDVNAGLTINWDVVLKEGRVGGDHFDKDHRTYYDRKSIEKYATGEERGQFIGELTEWPQMVRWDVSRSE